MSILESLKNLNVSEECFNDIISIVEEMINELNKYEQHKVDNDPKLKKALKKNQDALKEIGDDRKYFKNPYIGHKAVNALADANRDLLNRDEGTGANRTPNNTFNPPERFFKGNKNYSNRKKLRTEQSQRGSSKDPWRRGDNLADKERKANGLT